MFVYLADPIEESILCGSSNSCKAGLSLLVDTSGKLLSQRRACTRKDVVANARESRLL